MLNQVPKTGDDTAEVCKWLSDIFCKEDLDFDKASLIIEGQDCSTFRSAPLAVVYPKEVKTIQKLVREANNFNITLHPISRGYNWGYGSRCAPSSGSIIVDLSRMNKIVEVNDELAYAVIEPGVSQQQLYKHIVSGKYNLIMDATGAFPEASIIGNLVERGFGQTNYGDRFLNSAGLEIVLPNGELLKTGFGRYQNEAQHLHKWGLGPYIDGLFTQSNFGIVVKAGIWLMRKPRKFGVFFGSIKSDNDLGAIVEGLRELKLQGQLPATVHIANDLRMISVFSQFPFNDSDPNKRLSDSALAKLCSKWKVGKWNCVASVMGAAEEVKLRRRALKRVFSKIGYGFFISESFARFLKPFAAVIRRFSGQDVNAALSVINLMKGKPTDVPTRATYWRRQIPIPKDNLDPRRDRCGVIWCSPVFPATSSATKKIVKIIDQVCREHELETNVAITLVTERACCATIGIFFDNTQELQQQRASMCHKSLLDELVKHGYIPYRYGIDTVSGKNFLFEGSDPYWKLCKLLKENIDPNNIISPGKYFL
jgi:4-cresol dehydrogenase (hydroxylating) flavoprotein subunit